MAQKLNDSHLVSFKELLMANSIRAVFLDGKNVNLEMVKAGYAEVYRGTPAAGFDSALYWKSEEQARAAEKGMWAQGDKYISPREWRRMNSGK